VKRLRRYVPRHPFWSVVMLRLVMPMDVISYVLGLFADMTWRRYVLATALGLTPSAFILTYIGKTPRAYASSALPPGCIGIDQFTRRNPVQHV
jgi:uncharacterized membrane protein YdjX (TVP38/TMEM64 family)